VNESRGALSFFIAIGKRHNYVRRRLLTPPPLPPLAYICPVSHCPPLSEGLIEPSPLSPGIAEWTGGGVVSWQACVVLRRGRAGRIAVLAYEEVCLQHD